MRKIGWNRSAEGDAKQALQLEEGQRNSLVLWLSFREQQRVAGPLCYLYLLKLKKEESGVFGF